MDTSRKSQAFLLKNSDRVSVKEDSNIRDINENQAKINHSGNSNVNVHVNVEVDTKAIAYALLCSALAKKDLTDDEFQFALSKLEELTNNNKKKDKSNLNNESRWNKILFNK
jgi:hypothetical protein